MTLKYRRTDEKTTRAYERSPGMEPNPSAGVTHLAVVSNRGKRRPPRNPFQWIEGRGQQHEHVSRAYDTLAKARAWRKQHPTSEARLYPVDERGTIVSRPVRRKLSGNSGKEHEMAYNVQALRRAMRSNPRKRRVSVMEEETEQGVKVSSKGRRRKSTKRRRGSKRAGTAPKRRRSAKRATARKASRRPKRRASKRASKRGSRRRRSRHPVLANRRRRSRRRRSRRRISLSTNRRRSRRSRRPKRNARRGTGSQSAKGRKARASRRKSKRAIPRWKRYFEQGYVAKGYAPTAGPVYRTSKSRGRRPRILMYPVPKGQGRLTTRGKQVVRERLATQRSRRRLAANSSLVSNRRRSRRGSRRRHSVMANRRRSRRGSRRRRSVAANRRRSRRGSRRRRSRRVRPNLLTKSRVKWRGKGSKRRGRLTGRSYQVLMYGPGSKSRSGKPMEGYPIYIPGHVVERGALRRFRGLGGAAKKAHARKASRGRRSSMRKNRRSSRRRSTRRNPKYVVVNGRRRRVRRNAGMAILGGADLMNDVLIPVASGTAGFVGARVLSNALANMEMVRNLLDKDKPAAEASNTKIAANVVGIVATLGLGVKVPLIRRHQGAIVTGMGLALVDRLLGRVTGEAASYLGEYVNQPLGEYVNQPLGAYVNDPSMGEYVNQPLGGLGTLYAAAGYPEGVDPADQAGVDRTMDVMEAAAGMDGPALQAAAGTMYATAGLGTLYAAAGLGAEADATLQSYYQKHQPPFVSTQTPTDMAMPVTREMPYAEPVPESLVTPEGRGWAGGLFSRSLFAGML